jgi:hypothetical protein
MRKLILFLLLTSIFVSRSSAQVEKNSFYTELLVGRHFLKYNTNTIQPSVSIGISEHSVLGAFYRYNRYNSNPRSLYSGYSTKAGGGVSYSYYRYFNKKGKWGWYLNGSLGIFKVNVYEKQGNSTVLNYRYTERELTITPGVFFKPSPKVMLFANIGGLSLTNYQGINGHAGFASELNIGVQISFGGGKKKQR